MSFKVKEGEMGLLIMVGIVFFLIICRVLYLSCKTPKTFANNMSFGKIENVSTLNNDSLKVDDSGKHLHTVDILNLDTKSRVRRTNSRIASVSPNGLSVTMPVRSI